MLLAREFIGYLARQLVRKLTPQIFEVTDPQFAADFIADVIEAIDDESRQTIGLAMNQAVVGRREEHVAQRPADLELRS